MESCETSLTMENQAAKQILEGMSEYSDFTHILENKKNNEMYKILQAKYTSTNSNQQE